MFSFSDFNPYILMVTLFCIILMVFWPYVLKQVQWWIAFNKLPGPSYTQQIRLLLKLLFKTELIDLAATTREFLISHVRQYPLMGMGVGPKSFVLLSKAEAVKVLLSSKTQLDKASVYGFAEGLVGNGLATSKRAKWHQRRRLLTPFFHVEMLENYLVKMNEQAAILVSLLEEKSKQANAFDVCPYISKCTVDIICETAMGQRVNAQMKNDPGYGIAAEKAEELLIRRFLVPLFWFDNIFRFTPLMKRGVRLVQTAHGYIDEVIKNKQRQLAESKMANGLNHQLGNKRRLPMLDMLLDMSVSDSCSGSQQMTEEDIRDEVKTFMFTGSGTAVVTISWALYHIGRDPAVQQKIVDELNQVYEGDCDRRSSSDDLNNLKYLECVIKETLRLHPPSTLIGRHLTDELTICGSTIPADTDVYMSIYWVHRDPAHYPDPDTFDPNRFLPENSQGRDPFAFIAFSAGVRNCIGNKYAMMEVKVILSAILRRLKVNAVKQDKNSDIIGAFLVNPFDGIWVKLESRNTKVLQLDRNAPPADQNNGSY